jgi:hypothetical protein
MRTKRRRFALAFSQFEYLVAQYLLAVIFHGKTANGYTRIESASSAFPPEVS